MSTKVCVNCGVTAELLCSRCQDPYCSRQCQRLDWSSHRLICFNIPPLVRDMSAMDITSTRSAGDVHEGIDHEDKENAKKSVSQKRTCSEGEKKTTKAVEQEPKAEKEVSRLPIQTQNTSAAVELKEKPVEKKSVPEKKVVSDNEKKSTKPVQKEEEKAASAPAGKLLSAIETVPQKKPNDADKPMALKKQLPLKLPGSVVGRGMKFPDKAEEPKKPEPVKPLMMSDLKVRSWPDSKNIRVKILGLIEFNVMTLREDKEEVAVYFDYIQKEIANHCKNFDKSDYKPIVNEVIFTKYENDWYRAYVLEISGDKTIVKYIDYGNYDEVAHGTMFPASTALFEVCSRDFSIDNISEELTEKQRDIIYSGDLTITNVRKEADGTFHCSIFGF